MFSYRLLTSFPTTEKKQLLSLLGVSSPSLLIYGGVGLDCIEGHARAPTKPCELGYMIAAELATYRVPEILRPLLYGGGGIRRGVHSVL
jgi:hypothetical protein